MSARRARRILGALGRLPPATRRRLAQRLPPPGYAALAESYRPHPGQEEPEGDWRVWAMIAGRGFGKTRAGAEWVWARAREGGEGTRIALVAATLDEVRRVMVEGESGLLACALTGERPRWFSTRGEFRFPSGAVAFAYSAERPDMLRGPQHHFAWCDELAKWNHADAAWDNLTLGLRLGASPRTLVTTTPKPVPILKRLLALPGTVPTGGSTDSNPHLAPEVRAAFRALYAGTRFGRQELDGLLLEDLPGALWTREMLEGSRQSGTLPRESLVRQKNPFVPSEVEGRSPPVRAEPVEALPSFVRTVLGVDPPASTQGDACGIVVCALDSNGIAYVLADRSVQGLRPEGWAARVSAAAEAWGAQSVIAEKNQGGDMVESVLKAAACPVPVRLVHAAHGKAARAEPIALRFEKGEAKLAGIFPELEDQLCGLTYAGYQGPGASPDRADAMVWAMTELFNKPKAEPRILAL